MRKVAAIGLFSLLLCHILAHVLVLWATTWQEESDLTRRLNVYKSVDSLVEFYIPLDQPNVDSDLQAQPTEGFVYRGHYYDIVRQEIKNDTLLIVGYAKKREGFWQQDLLAFVKHQFGTDADTAPHKSHSLLKNLLKEYYQGVRLVLTFSYSGWQESVKIPAITAPLLTLSLPIHSPPPKA